MMNNQSNIGQGGVQCPQCKTKIPTSMQELVSAAKLVCPRCALELIIDRAASQRAIEAMNKVLDAQQNLDKASHFDGTVR